MSPRHIISPTTADAAVAGQAVHPCTHCARRPQEQTALNRWADEQFGGRPSVMALVARLNREVAYLVEFAAAGDADIVLDQLSFVVVLGYRLAEAYESDLWQQVTVKIAELQSMADHEERF